MALVKEFVQLLAEKQKRIDQVRPLQKPEPVDGFMSDPVCSICNKSIALETSKVDEDGKPVHEDCYIKRLVSARPRAS